MNENTLAQNKRTEDYLTIMIAGQRFGIPVLQVQDVLREQSVTKIPLAPPQIAGSLNLRGRIVTAINVRQCLDLEQRAKSRNTMSVVIEHNQELFSLIIDEVGDVLALESDLIEKNPGTIDQKWRDVSSGIYQLDNELLIMMDVSKLLEAVKP